MLRNWSIVKVSIAAGDIQGAGENLDDIVSRLLVVSEILGCEVNFFFNGVPVTIKPEMHQQEVVTAYLNYKGLAVQKLQ